MPLQSTIQNLKSCLPTYLPLPDAARKYGLPEQALTQLIQAGKIEAVQLPSGEILVSANNNRLAKTKNQIIAEKFGHLQEHPITVTEAIEKYDLNRSTILRWKNNGYITVLKPGYRLELDEADVAYCAFVHNERKKEDIVFGTRLFDDQGNPYELKHPDLARRRRKHQQREMNS